MQAYTLQSGRAAFSHRRFVVCDHPSEMVAGSLKVPDPRASGTRLLENKSPEVVFMFPGQGIAIRPIWEPILYHSTFDPVFKETIGQMLRNLIADDRIVI